MARGDIISINSAAMSGGTEFTMRPSSGDEWMITAFSGSDANQYFNMISGNGTTYMYFGEWDTDTVTTSVMKSDIPRNPIKWFISNSVYIKTGAGWTYYVWFMGIKTKE